MDTRRRDESSPQAWWRPSLTPSPFLRGRPRRKSRRELVLEGLEDRRLLSAGNLDPTFNAQATPGYNLYMLPGQQSDNFVEGTALAFQEEGNQEKIILAGAEAPSGLGGQSDFIVIRFDADGRLDTSFGDGGFATITFPDSNGISYDDEAYAVAIDANNNILVAGTATDANNDTEFAVARLTPDGELDQTFGGENGQPGTYMFPVGNAVNGEYDSEARAMGIDSYGNIVLGGYGYRDTGGDDGVAIAQLNSLGQLNTNFEGGGLRLYYISGDTDDQAYAMSITNGQILLGGTSQAGGNGTSMAVFDIDSSGSFNTDFGDANNGVETIPDPYGKSEYAEVQAMAVEPNGKIVLAGSDELSGGTGDQEFAVVGLNNNGTIDNRFGDDSANDPGIELIPFGNNTASYLTDADAVVVQNGQIVVAGQIQFGKHEAIALSRLSSEGSFDTSFGAGGLAVLNTMDPNNDDFADTALIQPNGDIVVGGNNDNEPDQFIVARISGSTSPSPEPVPQSQPVPPVPARRHRPVPARRHRPAPARRHRPVPARRHRPVPARRQPPCSSAISPSLPARASTGRSRPPSFSSVAPSTSGRPRTPATTVSPSGSRRRPRSSPCWRRPTIRGTTPSRSCWEVPRRGPRCN